MAILQGTGSQVTPGFPHSQIRLRVASPKVRERGRTTPMAYELASDTYYGLGVATSEHTTLRRHAAAKHAVHTPGFCHASSTDLCLRIATGNGAS